MTDHCRGAATLPCPLTAGLAQSVIQVFTLAFLVVGATCVAMIPIMLYILDLRECYCSVLHECCTAPTSYCNQF